MTMRNTENHWGWLSKLLHWLTAAIDFNSDPTGLLRRRTQAFSAKTGSICLA